MNHSIQCSAIKERPLPCLQPNHLGLHQYKAVTLIDSQKIVGQKGFNF